MKLFISSLQASGDTPIYGCTDPLADNYNPLATTDDGSCTYLDGNGYFTFPATFPITFEDN